MISSPTTAWMDFAIGDDRAKEAVALGWRHSTPRAMSGHAPLFPSRAGAYPWARRLTPRSLATYEVEADEEVWAGGGKAVACPRQSSFFQRWQSCSLRRTNVQMAQSTISSRGSVHLPTDDAAIRGGLAPAPEPRCGPKMVRATCACTASPAMSPPLLLLQSAARLCPRSAPDSNPLRRVAHNSAWAARSPSVSEGPSPRSGPAEHRHRR